MNRRETFLSDKLTEMINKQIGHELFNSNNYGILYNHFDAIGLLGCKDWFKNQYEEELEHAKLFSNFLTEAGAELNIPQIEQPKLDLGSLKVIMNQYLDLEIKTTESIRSLCIQAREDNDFISIKFLGDMIYKQLNEENEAQTRLQISLTTPDLIIADMAIRQFI